METTDSHTPTESADSTEPAKSSPSETVASSEPPGPSEVTEQAVDAEAVHDRLDRVHDPELDRSIVELQYVERVDIDGGDVIVVFVLPTAWCSPAFAWMMATGIRDEVGALPGVTSVTVRLTDHMHGDEITTGVNQGEPFESVFEDAEDGIEAVRRKLDEKARFARQHRAIRELQGAGLDAEQIATLTRADVDLEFGANQASVTVQDGALTVTVAREPLGEYLEKARATGIVDEEADPLFADAAGEPLDPAPEPFESTLQDARLAASNIEGQATICESLHKSRNDAEFD